ncbi:MAG: DUF3857 domain-containing protein [Blastocatellia bacterium]|nr:DUF3857 domain-containing protein [Blastocatellia bacterium]
MSYRLIVLCFALAVTCGPAYAGDDPPAWLRQAAAASLPAYEKDLPAVVLHKEQNITVSEDGRVTTVERFAIKVLINEGRRWANSSVIYTTDTGKVRDMRAWLIRPSGQVKQYGKKEVLDLAAAPDDVFNDVRMKVIDAEDDVEPGAIFGCEWTSEDRSVFTQFDWNFQERLPVLLSRFTLSLPTGWRAESVTFNHAKVDPAVAGTAYSWTLTNLRPIEPEPASPPVTNLAPRLAVSFFPPDGRRAGIGKTFDNWKDVSRWLTELSDPQAALNDEIATRARQLTADARTEFERIQAIGRFAQSVNYCSIQTGVGRGGGYRPHSAAEVFAKSYGDCKDKANLMRAMLRAVNIPAYMVSIYSGDSTYVREEWPSPQQFNHAIIAVKVSDETQAATVVKHPTLGRLLIFDPTDTDTPVGDLPDHEQGSLALIVAGEEGALLRMPVTPPEANKLERKVEAVLAPDGSIKATVREESVGQEAVSERGAFRGLSRPDYVKAIEKWITRGATGASVSKVEPLDNHAAGRFELDVEFAAARYGQLMQGRLLIFKPAIVSRRERISLTRSARKHPVVLDSEAYTETARIKLPEGFVVDELPDPVKLDTDFGNYRTAYEVKEGHLHFTRSLIIKGATLPADQYHAVRGFFERVRAAEQAPAVLVRK